MPAVHIVYACCSRWVPIGSPHRRSTPFADAVNARQHGVIPPRRAVHPRRLVARSQPTLPRCHPTPSRYKFKPRCQPTPSRCPSTPSGRAVSPRRRTVHPRHLAALSANPLHIRHLAALSVHAVGPQRWLTLSTHVTSARHHVGSRLRGCMKLHLWMRRVSTVSRSDRRPWLSQAIHVCTCQQVRPGLHGRGVWRRALSA